MNWILIAAGGILLVILIKIIGKAIKIGFVLLIAALLVLILWLWQQGLIFK